MRARPDLWPYDTSPRITLHHRIFYCSVETHRAVVKYEVMRGDAGDKMCGDARCPVETRSLSRYTIIVWQHSDLTHYHVSWEAHEYVQVSPLRSTNFARALHIVFILCIGLYNIRIREHSDPNIYVVWIYDNRTKRCSNHHFDIRRIFIRRINIRAFRHINTSYIHISYIHTRTL